jgi:hypothetical protein
MTALPKPRWSTRGRKQRPAEIDVQVEAHIPDQPEEAVRVIVGVNRREVVGAGGEIEVGADRLGGRRDRRRLDVPAGDDGAQRRVS